MLSARHCFGLQRQKNEFNKQGLSLKEIKCKWEQDNKQMNKITSYCEQ